MSVTPQASPLASRLVVETTASATPNVNVTGTSGVIYMIDVDNSANVAAVYLKLYDNPAPTVGTTPADWVVRIGPSVRRSAVIPEGYAYTALSFAVVTGAAEDNTTSPASPVIVRLATS